MKKLDSPTVAMAVAANVVLFVACARDPLMSDGTGTMTGDGSTGDSGPATTATTAADSTGGDTSQPGDLPALDMGTPDCTVDGSCAEIDLLFVIDNSGTMGDEQSKLSSAFAGLVQDLQDLEDSQGNPLQPSVNIMVTTTDMGHPLCTPFQQPDYTPAAGSPIYRGCNQRLNRFVGLDPDEPVVVTEVCTDHCPVDVEPVDHFIHFDADGSNVPNDVPDLALMCIGPQGIDGCGYEAPLESMVQALLETACWNDPQQPGCQEQAEWEGVTEGFLREDSIVAVVMVTDELDCSVDAPDGFSFFIDINNTVYWNLNPETENAQASSAICFNAGVSCDDLEGDGLYEGCTAQDNDALHPVSRYTAYLDSLLASREVVMLDLVGVPSVVAHNPNPPYEPIAGGVHDLLYRDWIDAPFPSGDILPNQWDIGLRAADMQFLFGSLAPGCTAIDEVSGDIGQALPPVRTREVCQALDGVDGDTGEAIVRCCMESICDGDYSLAIDCLGGTLAQAIERGGAD